MSRRAAAVVGLTLVAGWVSLPTPTAAQEKAVHYVGTFTHIGGGTGGCPLISHEVGVTLNGGKVSGYWVNQNGQKSKFKGKMTGSSFNIVRRSKVGNDSRISGELADGSMDVRFEGPKCSYRATLEPRT